MLEIVLILYQLELRKSKRRYLPCYKLRAFGFLDQSQDCLFKTATLQRVNAVGISVCPSQPFGLQTVRRKRSFTLYE
jgi:hypothetical protein